MRFFLEGEVGVLLFNNIKSEVKYKDYIVIKFMKIWIQFKFLVNGGKRFFLYKGFNYKLKNVLKCFMCMLMVQVFKRIVIVIDLKVFLQVKEVMNCIVVIKSVLWIIREVEKLGKNICKNWFLKFVFGIKINYLF